MGRCCAPCDGSVGREEYSALVERVRDALCTDARPAVTAVSARLGRLVDEHRYEEAETFCRKALTLREEFLAPEHPDLAESLEGLADLLTRAGRGAEARPYWHWAEQVRAFHKTPDVPSSGG